ncbi:hypothetical protein ZWY2020_003306 [Hordeum vulgare]|nr:hypothetical protein ZWY2020_003306 [Hordeum vulgare]
MGTSAGHTPAVAEVVVLHEQSQLRLILCCAEGSNDGEADWAHLHREIIDRNSSIAREGKDTHLEPLREEVARPLYHDNRSRQR